MRNLILGLSLSVALIVGCLAGPEIVPTLAPPVRAAPGTPRWEYKCFSGPNNEDVERKANRLGLGGFEMIAGDH